MRTPDEYIRTNIRGSVKRFFGNDPTLGQYSPLSGTLLDMSGKGGNATLTGSGTFAARSGAAGVTPNTTTGVNGATIADAAGNSPTGDYTIMAWIYPVGWNSSAQDYVITKDGGQPNRSFGVAINGSGGDLYCYNSVDGTNTTTSGLRTITCTDKIRLGRWQHVVVQLNESGDDFWYGWVNGRYQGKSDFGAVGGGTFDSTQAVGIGHLVASSTNTAFNGLVAEVAIFKRLLTDQEISGYYKSCAQESRRLWGQFSIAEVGGATKTYTREAFASLPTTNADLATVYTAQDLTDVATDDGIRVAITTDYATGIPIHLYKYLSENPGSAITLTWNGQSSVAPSRKSVYLQIWNFNSSAWETLATESGAAANTDFTMTGVQSTNLAYYYDGGNFVHARVYQAS